MNKRIWLKWSAVITLILVVSGFLYGMIGISFFKPFAVLIMFPTVVMQDIGVCYQLGCLPFMFLAAPMEGLIFGAIITWIYEKIKNRNSMVSQ
jgi:hypothetical protein